MESQGLPKSGREGTEEWVEKVILGRCYIASFENGGR